LHPQSSANLADLVRVMNAYYTNLIEGHNTRPRDIERALLGDLDDDIPRRDLQLEAAAHVRLQATLDQLAINDELPEPASKVFISQLHKDFYSDAPESMLRVEGSNSTFVMKPGEWRSQSAHDVTVGRHVPPSSEVVERFMQRFSEAYLLDSVKIGQRLMLIPAAHHRFNYIHPFPDGNGRVSRLMSHAMVHWAGIGAHGLWSVSRGLARFMTNQFELDRLDARYDRLVAGHDTLKPEASALLKEALRSGQFERGQAARITGLPPRTAQRVLQDVIAEGLLASTTPKGAVSLRFPASTLESLFPGLYSEV